MDKASLPLELHEMQHLWFTLLSQALLLTLSPWDAYCIILAASKHFKQEYSLSLPHPPPYPVLTHCLSMANIQQALLISAYGSKVQEGPVDKASLPLRLHEMQHLWFTVLSRALLLTLSPWDAYCIILAASKHFKQEYSFRLPHPPPYSVLFHNYASAIFERFSPSFVLPFPVWML